MTTRGHNQLFPNGPGLDPGSSTLLSKSNTVLSGSNTLSPKIRAENQAVAAANQIEKQQSLRSPPSVKDLRSRRALENLVVENATLRAEVETIQSRQADKLERMVTDLVKAKSELRAKDIRLSGQQNVIDKQSLELEQLRRDFSDISAELKDTRLAQSNFQKSSTLQAAIGQPTTEIREKDLPLREENQILQEQEFELLAIKDDAVEMQELQNIVKSQGHTQRARDDSQLETEHPRVETLQRELQDLKIAHASALSQIDTGNATIQQYLDELSRSKATKETAQSAVDTERAKSLQYLQEIDQRNAAHRLLQSQIKAHEAKTEEVTQELDNLQASFEKTVTEMREKLQAHEQLEASHTDDLTDARRMAKFFKKNSEASTQKVKRLETEIQSLKQSVQRDQDVVEDGTNTAAPSDANSSEPPGAWPDTDIRSKPPRLQRKAMAVSNMS